MNRQKNRFIDIIFVISYIIFLMCQFIIKDLISILDLVMILPITCITVGVCWILNKIIALIYLKVTSKDISNTIKFFIAFVIIFLFAYFYVCASLYNK